MERARRISRVTAGVLIVILVLASSGLGAATLTPTSSAHPAEPLSASTAVQQTDETNNSSVQHERPDRANEDGDLSAVHQWLGSELGSYLGDSTLELSQGQYEAARSALGDDYTESLGKFVDVAGETQESLGGDNGEDAPSPAEQQETLNQTRSTQREYVDTAESFEETYTAYQEAKAAGNESRARELARRLRTHTTQITTLTTDLRSYYRQVENITGTSLAPAIQRINQTTANFSEVSQSVTVAEFIQTRLTVSKSAQAASFTNPVTLTGQIETPPNASAPPPSGTVTLQVGDRRFETTVTDAGTFSVEYRPVTVRTGQRDIELQYVPSNDSIYLDATTNTSFAVTAVTPTIAVTQRHHNLRFGQATNLTGRVTVNGTAVPDLPLTVQLGGTTIDRVETGPAGQFNSPASLPVQIPPGEHSLAVTVAVEERAIRSTTTNRTVTVAEAETALSMNGTWTDNGVTVSGRLTTIDGVPAPGQPVRISTNGTQQATVQTDETGTFQTVFRPSQQPRGNQTLTVRASYVGEGTNLANASGETRLSPPTGADTAPDGQVNGNSETQSIGQVVDRDYMWLIVGVGGAGILGGVYWWRRRTTQSATKTTDEAQSTTTADRPSEPATPETGEEPSPLTAAIDALEAGDDPDHAVRLAFATVRETLAETIDSVDITSNPTPVTHWEFYRAYKDAVPNEEALRELTDAYERATYAPDQTTTAGASDAITAAEDLLTVATDGEESAPD